MTEEETVRMVNFIKDNILPEYLKGIADMREKINDGTPDDLKALIIKTAVKTELILDFLGRYCVRNDDRMVKCHSTIKDLISSYALAADTVPAGLKKIQQEIGGLKKQINDVEARVNFLFTDPLEDQGPVQ